ncbi:related to PRM10 - Pheromone-regulated protein, proposed to be involved in mating [Ustilago sp. UG-2017b]|nr:related to PRM10 - Pheromone-regulated protein, proposed to be involved in mating [Ustilago sp. UG-2017b]
MSSNQTFELDADDAATAAAETIPSLSLTGAMGLDEQGLDNRAFLELQREVLRHEARSDDGSRQGADDAAGKDRLADIFMDREREFSGLTTPGSVTSESSYDPANDTDLDCIDLLSGKEIKVASPTLANVWVMMLSACVANPCKHESVLDMPMDSHDV